MFEIAGIFLFSYLLGSVPFGLLLTKIAGLGDIRAIGSGNIGATNVLRTGRKDLAFATLILDGGKGALAVGIAWLLFNSNVAAFAGMFAAIGHTYPIFLKFKGGKGVATTLGTLLAMNVWLGLVAIGTWLLLAGIFRMSSLAALVAFLISILAATFIATWPQIIVVSVLSALIFWRHKGNISRLLNGTEPKIGDK
jgi:acyl phosphate:glycerol-3-phosphate acyltransferase